MIFHSILHPRWLPLWTTLALGACATSSPPPAPPTRGPPVLPAPAVPSRSRSPSPAPAVPSPAGTFHTVKTGETVWDLARRSGLSVEEIVEVNRLRSANEVKVGQVLFLPARGRVDREAPSAPSEVPVASSIDEPVASSIEPMDEPIDDEPPSPPGETPLAWPVDGIVLRDFVAAGAPTKGRMPFDGLLIAAPAGSPVRAAADGEVLFVGDQGTDYGLLIIVNHGSRLGPLSAVPGDGKEAGFVTVYGHLSDPIVKSGDTVRTGQRLASVGTSGSTESPRLHFQARRGRTTIDPLPLLPP